MTAPPDLAAIAAVERDHAARLLSAHQAACPSAEKCPFCGTWHCRECVSLARHADRTRRQADLLTPSETPEMF